MEELRQRVKRLESQTEFENSEDDIRIKRLEERVELILEKMEKVETLVTKIVDEVKPTIDELMQSSLFKMLGMKRGK